MKEGLSRLSNWRSGPTTFAGRERISSFVPSRTERLALTPPELHYPAAHELFHALVGYEYGYLGNISLAAKGRSLARVSFYGHIPPEVFQIIAAAGAFSTQKWTAWGYGMDMAMIDIIRDHPRIRGITRGQALDYAKKILSKYPTKILERAAEIVAYLKEVPSWRIPYILEQAQAEVMEEEGHTGEYQQLVLPDKNSFVPRSIKQRTIIEDLGNRYRLIYVDQGKIIDTIMVCRVCAGENGHQSFCPLFKQTQKQNPVPSGFSPLPQSGRVFRRKI